MKEESKDTYIETLIKFLLDPEYIKENIEYEDVEPHSNILTGYSEDEFISEVKKYSSDVDCNLGDLRQKFQYVKSILTDGISKKEEEEAQIEKLKTNSEKLVDILLKNNPLKKEDITYEIDNDNNALDIKISDLNNVIDKFNISLSEEVLRERISKMYNLDEVD